MIEITYADMFLICVILTLLGMWIKARVEIIANKVVMKTAIEHLHTGEAETYSDGKVIGIRRVEK